MIETMCKNPGLVEVMQEDLAKNGTKSKWTVDKVFTFYYFIICFLHTEQTNSDVFRGISPEVQTAVYREIMAERITSQGIITLYNIYFVVYMSNITQKLSLLQLQI